jgi:hypothetical protein
MVAGAKAMERACEAAGVPIGEPGLTVCLAQALDAMQRAVAQSGGDPRVMEVCDQVAELSASFPPRRLAADGTPL